jgi:hypothetical protein
MTVKFVNGPGLTESCIKSSDTIVYINDHYDPYLLDFIKKQNPNTLVFQSFFCVYPTELDPVLWIPKFLINQPVVDRKLADHVNTLDCFNFSIYKLRSLRQIALGLIEKQQYQTNHYTLNNQSADVRPFCTPSKIFNEPQFLHYTNNDWNNFLAKQVYEPTVVSLITETLELDWGACMTYTEKTVYSVLGLTFPVWLGGYRQAETWGKFGFDTFDDVINHNYQYQTDPTLSMSQALSDNDHLLRDLSLAKHTRNCMLPRLIQNRQKFLEYSFQNQISQILEKNCPEQVTEIEEFLKICFPCI